MRFCFIIEAQYRNEPMPIVIAKQLQLWGHNVDMLEPQAMITCLSDLNKHRYDAYILKTVSDGPGLSLLEAAEATGIPTINNSRAIRLVRDKAVATAFAHANGLPTPLTYFVAHPDLLQQIPAEDYPLVVKPTNGSSCRGIYRLDSPDDLASLQIAEVSGSYLLAQRYMENCGFDIKLYVAGTEVYGVAKRSPLHPEIEVSKQLIPLTRELRGLALRVGQVFGLDIYGLDIVETAQGPMIVDINDFPSFGQVPKAVPLVSSYIEHIAMRTHLQHGTRMKRMHRNGRALIEVAMQRINAIRTTRQPTRSTFGTLTEKASRKAE